MVSQLGQVLLLRELLMVFYGSEFAIGIIFACWLAWVGLGSRLGGAVSARLRRPAAAVGWCAAALAVVVPVTILLIRLLRGFFDVLPGEYVSMSATVWSCLLIMAPACLLLGFQFVMISRVWREAAGEADHSGATGTYVFEAAGNALGGALFSLLLVHFLNPFQLAVLVAVLLPAAALGLRRQAAGRWLPAGLAAGTALALLAAGPVDELAFRLQWKSFAPEQELVETRQSKYGVISVARHGGQYNFFQSGHLAFSTGALHGLDYELEEAAAALLAHFAAVQHPDPHSVLLIGGGLRGVLRELSKHPVSRIDYVELDRALVDLALEYVPRATLDALRDPRVRLITRDGRLFLRSSPEPYDLIIVDVPDPATAVLNRFYTLEFFQELNRLLSPGGVVVTGIGSTADLRARALANRNAALFHSMQAVFDDVFAVGGSFAFFCASNMPGRISAEPAVLRQRFQSRAVQPGQFSDAYFFTLLQEPPLQRLNWVLRNHGRSTGAHLDSPPAPPLFPGSPAEQAAADTVLPPPDPRFFINSDLRPVGYFYTVMHWHSLARTGQTRLFDLALRARLAWVSPVVAAALVVLLLLRWLPRRALRGRDADFALLFAITTTGFSTMALQIALIFSFQSVYGFVYEMIGLIIALFMAGLALGAATTNRVVRNKQDRRSFAGIQFLVAAYAAAVALALPHAAAGEPWLTFALFAGLTFFAGCLNGAGFPLATVCCIMLGRPAEKAAGTVYGNELAGACIGALLAGVFVAPVMGVVACCLLAATLNGTAFCLILLGRRSSWEPRSEQGPT